LQIYLNEKQKLGILAYLCFKILGEKEIIYFYGLLIKLKKVLLDIMLYFSWNKKPNLWDVQILKLNISKFVKSQLIFI